MAREIDVDIDALKSFVDAMRQFQAQTTDRFKAVEADWSVCDASWKGDAKQGFTQEFEQTRQSISDALENGDQAVRWLEKLHEILEEFERR